MRYRIKALIYDDGRRYRAERLVFGLFWWRIFNGRWRNTEEGARADVKTDRLLREPFGGCDL